MLVTRLNQPGYGSGPDEQKLYDNYLREQSTKEFLNWNGGGAPTTSLFEALGGYLQRTTQRDINRMSPTQSGQLEGIISAWSPELGTTPEDYFTLKERELSGFNPVSREQTARFGGLFG
jgi:hypothetical protein